MSGKKYWLISANFRGEGTTDDMIKKCFNQSVLMTACGPEKCPQFYNEIQSGDMFVVAKNSHKNSVVCYAGLINGKLNDCPTNENCGFYYFLPDDCRNDELQEIIRRTYKELPGGDAENPYESFNGCVQLDPNLELSNKLKDLADEAMLFLAGVYNDLTQSK